MRQTENKKVTIQGVDSKYRCNLCGHLTNNFGGQCPHCGTIINNYTATDVTMDFSAYR